MHYVQRLTPCLGSPLQMLVQSLRLWQLCKSFNLFAFCLIKFIIQYTLTPRGAFISLFLEWCGGLAVIAMSDVFQGLVMFLSFVMITSVMKKNFGGWTDLNPETYPRPEFYQTQSAGLQCKSTVSNCYITFIQYTLTQVLYSLIYHRSLIKGNSGNSV